MKTLVHRLRVRRFVRRIRGGGKAHIEIGETEERLGFYLWAEDGRYSCWVDLTRRGVERLRKACGEALNRDSGRDDG